MGQDPIHAAQQEQAQRQAVFQRARAKLAAARGAEEQRRSYDSKFRSALGTAVLAVIGIGAIGLVVWAKPEALDPATWRSDPFLPAMLGIVLLAMVAGIVYRRLKKPATPAEIAVRDFYETASGDTWDADKLCRHVIQADLDDAERRAPAFENGIIRPERLDSPGALKRYWRSMFRPGFMLRYESKVKSVSLTPLADDLMLAHVKLRVYRFSWALAMIMISVLGLVSVMAQDYLPGTPWQISALMLTTFGAFSVCYVLPQIRKADFTVRKLLVRCGENWRIFCADWEGWEEADLSWLDGQEPRAGARGSVECMNMDQSPTTAAAAEQAQREAAFARARRKLAAARCALPVLEKRHGRWLAVIAVFLCALYFLAIGVYVWWRPESLSPSNWAHDHTIPATLIAVPVTVALLALVRWLNARQQPAEGAIRAFYTLAGSMPKALRECVIEQDLDAAPRRAPSQQLPFGPSLALDSPESLTGYWKSLLRPDRRIRLGLHAKSVRLTPISDDLMLAQVKLQVTRAAPVKTVCLLILSMVVYAVAQWWSIGTILEKPLILVWMVSVFLILAFTNKSMKEPVAVRKLLVHSGGKWRLFCGDWEGWEEADLSWLDEQDPRAVCEANVA